MKMAGPKPTESPTPGLAPGPEKTEVQLAASASADRHKPARAEMPPAGDEFLVEFAQQIDTEALCNRAAATANRAQNLRDHATGQPDEHGAISGANDSRRAYSASLAGHSSGKHDVAAAIHRQAAMTHEAAEKAARDAGFTHRGGTHVSIAAEHRALADEHQQVADTEQSASLPDHAPEPFHSEEDGRTDPGSRFVEDLINRDPTGFADDATVKEWGENAKGTLGKAAREASIRALKSGTVEDHSQAYRYHAGACSAHRAANDEARQNPGCFRDEWKHHFEKAMAHQDLVFALQRGLSANPRLQHHLLTPEGKGDEKDARFIHEAMASHDRREGPRIGDFVRFPDGALHRLAVDHGGSGFQTVEPDRGAFYLGGPDQLVFSCGGPALVPFVQPEQLTLLDESLAGEVWTFHHQNAVPGGRVNGVVPLRVYVVTPEARGEGPSAPEKSRIPVLLANHSEDIRAALIAYRFGNQSAYNAAVDKVLRESGAELWEYVEASSKVQEETGLTLEAIPDGPGPKPSSWPPPYPRHDPDEEAFDRFVADQEGRHLD